MKKIFCLVCIALLFISCKSTTKETVDNNYTFDVNTVWVLKSIKNKNINFSETEKSVTIQFNPESNTINGNTGCNAFFGSYSEPQKGNLEIPPVTRTKIACPQNIMEIERLFVATLPKVTSYKMSDKSLDLLQNGNVVLSFDKKE